jgi:hypothetical protein
MDKRVNSISGKKNKQLLLLLRQPLLLVQRQCPRRKLTLRRIQMPMTTSSTAMSLKDALQAGNF